MITIKHGGNKFDISFPQKLQVYGRTWANHTTLHELAFACSKQTGVHLENIKLLICGENSSSKPFSSLIQSFISFVTAEGESSSDSAADDSGSYGWKKTNDIFLVVMKDAHASLAKYGIKSGSKVMMLGDNQSRAPALSPPQDPIRASIKKLDDIRRHTEEQLLPLVDQFLLLEPQQYPRNEENNKQLKTQQMRLNEGLLQQLLKIDSMAVLEDGNIRAMRKQVVCLLNELMEKVDAHAKSLLS